MIFYVAIYEEIHMTQEAGAPAFSWDDTPAQEDAGSEDFLSDVDGQPVPKACSLDDPTCEACQ
ncbi:hypothetical protein [Pseudomonas putida]|uniref:Uncharacterized protein n=1 Tax=Pseudomonas putida TaxID=303 RepID=A0A8I1EBQ3_PSEPU|nr:hypothetical protein [Pseudomonas putida]MBI6883107.1 hypothetical protein [Pseudomonas putida]